MSMIDCQPLLFDEVAFSYDRGESNSQDNATIFIFDVYRMEGTIEHRLIQKNTCIFQFNGLNTSTGLETI